MELLVVSALLMIVGGGLLTSMIAGRTSYLSADAYVQVQQEARRAFDNVVRELREAQVEPATAANIPLTQLNFRIALGYNLDATACPNAICWGSEPNFYNNWIHYATIDADGNAATTNDRQLVRCVNQSATGPITSSAGCRVLANHIAQVGGVNQATFTYVPAPTNTVTVSLRIQYDSPLLPGGSHATPLLTSRVKLRN